MRAYDLMLEHHKEIKCIMYKYDPNTLSRHAWVSRENNNAPYKTYPQPSNAFTILETHTDAKHQQGAIVCLAGMAEERPFATRIEGGTHYSNVEFLDVAGYSIAHELFHLLCGPDDNLSAGTVFGTGPKLSTLQAPLSEVLQINLKERRGVTQ